MSVLLLEHFSILAALAIQNSSKSNPKYPTQTSDLIFLKYVTYGRYLMLIPPSKEYA